MSLKSLLFNFSILVIFYLFKGLVFVMVYAEPIIILIMGGILIRSTTRLIRRKITDRKKIKNFIIFTLSLFITMIYGRHLITISGIITFKNQTLSILTKYNKEIPIEDRFNGAWILDDNDFKSKLTKRDFKTLKKNYNGLNPLLIDNGIFYIEIAGGLKGGGGYYYKLTQNSNNPTSLGFYRINDATRIIGQWYHYD